MSDQYSNGEDEDQPWGIPLKYRRALYKTVIERVLAHGAVGTGVSTIQRPFVLEISSAYRTTSAVAVQVILGIPPLQLHLQRAARGTALYKFRLPVSTNVSDIDLSEIEETATGWSAHPSEHRSPTQISHGDGGNINTGLRICTDGSDTESKLLHSHPHIRVSWIKAHAGYIGTEKEDRLAKEAAKTEKFPKTPFKLPKSFIRIFLRQKIMATWQMPWDYGDTGRLIHNIIPKVSLQPIN
ncbi:hypothetical protein AVEN_212587-1 [Araneus ventricosus]|uniref:RNase H type-1 domain-containing protein n=1 Tax=Araneus ventricosus TaxID=182803 RepID=A0A4Y2LP23_ARAVE|nr:hypothetical protein AVEN_212587-1 [Araneus ventricosus]